MARYLQTKLSRIIGIMRFPGKKAALLRNVDRAAHNMGIREFLIIYRYV